MAFSPDGQFLASGSDDSTVRLWDIQANTLVKTFQGHSDSVRSVAFSHNGQFLASGSDDSTVRLWNIENKIVCQALTGGNKGNWQIVVNEQILFRGDDGTFLKSKTADGNTHPLIPPGMASMDSFSVATFPETISVVPGETRPIEVRVQNTGDAPLLTWTRARLESDNKTLRVDLHNSGNVALRNFSVNLNQPPKTQADLAPDVAARSMSIPKLGSGETEELAFVLSDSIDWKKINLTLTGRTAELPIFHWNFPAPPIERTSRLLYWLLIPLAATIMIGLFYLRRYRHPLVVQLSEKPGALLQLPPEQLNETRIRLNQTGRLDKILSEAQVAQKRFDAAIAFFHQPSPPEKARQLADRLGAGIESKPKGIWELHLPDTFPLNLDRCLLYVADADAEPGGLLDDLNKIRETRFRPTLLIGPDSDFQRRLLNRTRDRTNKLVAPSGSDITGLMLSPEPVKVLARIMATQLSLTLLSPYQLGWGVNREPLFFGRQEIITHIMNREPANYLLVSGRQLGKSSLLKALMRRYSNHPEVTCLYLSLSSEVLVPRLASALGLSDRVDLEGIAAHATQSKGRFLILIDEADKFIRKERETDYPILDAMRRMSEEGHCNFILAGFWELYQHAVLDYQSPLKNFAEIIQIGELEPDACRRLAIEPMQNIRLTYAEPKLVDRLIHATGQRANLMVIACQEILSGLRPDQRIIEAADVDRAIHSQKLSESLKGWAAMTDDAHACNMDHIIVYATIDKERFTLKNLIEILKRRGLKPEIQKLDHSLDRLTIGFVLGKDETGGYYYRVPLFQEMIIKSDCRTRLEKALDACRLDE